MLASLLDKPLVVVDVGCRWGLNPVWESFGDRCVLIGFDPDAEECARLNALVDDHRNARFVPVALGPEPGLATLYMTKDPGGYSVYPPSVDAVEHHPGLDGGRVEQTMVIGITSLDDWCREEGVDRIDVVKLDTQGSELGILEGASEALAGVRAVEVEVQFNELYEGVPLFGDVDRFLREHGFVLWRLRNLAHYAQHGAPTEWHTRDVQYFDETAAVIRSGCGQLYWADAFFVKADVARPNPNAGWRALVRDACVCQALRFQDLMVLILRQACVTAPPTARRQLDQILATELDMVRPSVVLQGVVKFDLGRPDLKGWGWGPPQVHDFGSLRWTGPGRDASVDLPTVVVPGTRVELLIVAGMTEAILESVSIELDRVVVPIAPTPHPHGRLYVGRVPSHFRSQRPFTRLVVRTSETMPWNEVHPDSDDDSELGVAVAWIRLTAPEDR